MSRILVIRGGAIGDFILTLPAIKLLRDAFPAAHLEILGYKHIVALAEMSGYANATRSIEYGPLSSFFSRDGELAPDLVDYFGSFQQVISYLFDPDADFCQQSEASRSATISSSVHRKSPVRNTRRDNWRVPSKVSRFTWTIRRRSISPNEPRNVDPLAHRDPSRQRERDEELAAANGLSSWRSRSFDRTKQPALASDRRARRMKNASTQLARCFA